MHTSFFFANALLNFSPNLFSMLALRPSSCTFGCDFLSLLTMLGSEDVVADLKGFVEGRRYEVTRSKSGILLQENKDLDIGMIANGVKV